MITRTDCSRAVLGALTAALMAATAAAQTPANDARWEPWVGCWKPDAQENAAFQRSSRVCVTQIGGAAVEVATVADARVVARDTIDASGTRRAIGAGGCTGWQRGDWSSDGRRVYLHSEVSCGTTLTRTSTGVIAMAPAGIWLDIQRASAGGNASVREVRYSVAGPWMADIPAEFTEMVRTRDLTPYAMVARELASSPIGTKDVVEASKQVDADVVQAWLIERGQPIDVDARTLQSLADAGVPGSVTDVLIGLAFPDRFTLTSMTAPTYANSPSNALPPRNGYDDCAAAFDPMWYSTYGFDACYARYGAYRYAYRSPYGYGNYGYGYGFGYDVPFYGYGVGSVTPGKPAPPHGVVINGQGYTRPRAAPTNVNVADQGSSRVGRDAAASSGGSSSPRSSGSSSSGRSSSGGSSSGSSSGSGRTAQARPPDPPKPVKPPPAP